MRLKIFAITLVTFLLGVSVGLYVAAAFIGPTILD
jgi:hypothetical protein